MLTQLISLIGGVFTGFLIIKCVDLIGRSLANSELFQRHMERKYLRRVNRHDEP